jgi:hypothetical protein
MQAKVAHVVYLPLAELGQFNGLGSFDGHT